MYHLAEKITEVHAFACDCQITANVLNFSYNFFHHAFWAVHNNINDKHSVIIIISHMRRVIRSKKLIVATVNTYHFGGNNNNDQFDLLYTVDWSFLLLPGAGFMFFNMSRWFGDVANRLFSKQKLCHINIIATIICTLSCYQRMVPSCEFVVAYRAEKLLLRNNIILMFLDRICLRAIVFSHYDIQRTIHFTSHMRDWLRYSIIMYCVTLAACHARC